jgi:hypothetical protein
MGPCTDINVIAPSPLVEKIVSLETHQLFKEGGMVQSEGNMSPNLSPRGRSQRALHPQ